MALPKVTIGEIRFEMDVEVSEEEKQSLIAYLNEIAGFKATWGGFEIPNDCLLIALNKGISIKKAEEYVNNWLAAQSRLQNV